MANNNEQYFDLYNVSSQGEDYNTGFYKTINQKNRMDTLTMEMAKEMNTYRGFPFYLNVPAQEVIKDGEFKSQSYNVGEQYKDQSNGIKLIGLKSLFNNVNGVPAGLELRKANNMPLLDNPKIRQEMREQSDCSIRALVKESESANSKLGMALYNYADFMYCKHLGKVSNNHLITLRRFPAPVGDHINWTIPEEQDVNKNYPDVGRMVTWMGVSGNEMTNLLKYSVKMPFKKMKAELQIANTSGDDGAAGWMGTMLNGMTAENQKAMINGYGGQNQIAIQSKLLSLIPGGVGKTLSNLFGPPPYTPADMDMDYKSNKIYGPIDVIKDVYMRDDKEGLQFDHKITLNFEYELRSYDGINGKAAMLDLLANILATTYTHGKFWGGGVKYFGTQQSSVFANLPIYNKVNSFSDVVDLGWKSLTNWIDKWKEKTPGEIIDNIQESFQKYSEQFVDSFGASLLGGLLNKIGRPQRIGLNALLSGAPVGLWHVMIGNPKHPILSMGNMILTNTTIEHKGPLGLDDFPTELKVTCELEHGKGRDINLIEQMYLMGDNRIYSPMGSQIKHMYENSKEYKAAGGKNTVNEMPPEENDTDAANDTAKEAKEKNGSAVTGTSTSSVSSSTDTSTGSQGTKTKTTPQSSADNVERSQSSKQQTSETVEQEKKNTEALNQTYKHFFGGASWETVQFASAEALYGMDRTDPKDAEEYIQKMESGGGVKGQRDANGNFTSVPAPPMGNNNYVAGTDQQYDDLSPELKEQAENQSIFSRVGDMLEGGWNFIKEHPAETIGFGITTAACLFSKFIK